MAMMMEKVFCLKLWDFNVLLWRNGREFGQKDLKNITCHLLVYINNESTEICFNQELKNKIHTKTD
jgi:hypothetical protein